MSTIEQNWEEHNEQEIERLKRERDELVGRAADTDTEMPIRGRLAAAAALTDVAIAIRESA